MRRPGYGKNKVLGYEKQLKRQEKERSVTFREVEKLFPSIWAISHKTMFQPDSMWCTDPIAQFATVIQRLQEAVISKTAKLVISFKSTPKSIILKISPWFYYRTCFLDLLFARLDIIVWFHEVCIMSKISDHPIIIFALGLCYIHLTLGIYYFHLFCLFSLLFSV